MKRSFLHHELLPHSQIVLFTGDIEIHFLFIAVLIFLISVSFTGWKDFLISQKSKFIWETVSESNSIYCWQAPVLCWSLHVLHFHFLPILIIDLTFSSSFYFGSCHNLISLQWSITFHLVLFLFSIPFGSSSYPFSLFLATLHIYHWDQRLITFHAFPSYLPPSDNNREDWSFLTWQKF